MKHLLIAAFLVCNIAAAPIETPEPDLRMAVWPDRPLLDPQDDVFEHKEIIRIRKVTRPSLEFYKAKNVKGAAPAVIVCPGGGYSILAYDKEGTDIATWLNSIGFHAIVLRYTVPGNQRDEALKDAQRTMGIVRSRSKEWGINPDQIGILGFSAGGHLSANLSSNYKKRNYDLIDDSDKISCKPNFAVLVYPAYLFTKEDKTKLPPEIKINAETPPTFIVQTLDDRRWVESAFNYSRALHNAKVNCELHLYAKGGHGYGMRPSDNPVSQWGKLCEIWLKGICK